MKDKIQLYLWTTCLVVVLASDWLVVKAVPQGLSRKSSNLFRREQYLKQQNRNRNVYSLGGREALSEDEGSSGMDRVLSISSSKREPTTEKKRSGKLIDTSPKHKTREEKGHSRREDPIGGKQPKVGKLILSEKTLHSLSDSDVPPFPSLHHSGPTSGGGPHHGFGRLLPAHVSEDIGRDDISIVPGGICQTHDITDGILTDPDDCSRYFVCAFGQEFSKSCPLGLLWNDKTKSCDWPDNVTCTNKNHVMENMVDLRCGRDKISCASGNQCIFLDQLCDKKVDCHDSSDEITCDPYKVGVLPGKIISVDGGTIIPFCGSGHALCTSRTQCVIISQLCDGVENCPDGSDEAEEMCLKSPRK